MPNELLFKPPSFAAEKALFSKKSAVSNIVDDKLVADWVKEAPEVVAAGVPKVISQAIPAGTPVKKGTAVDLVLAPKSVVPGKIAKGIYGAWKESTLEEVEKKFDPFPEAKGIIAKYENAADLKKNEADFSVVSQALQAAGVPIDDNNADTSFESAFVGMKFAQEFSL
jgi:hypothetical protein